MRLCIECQYISETQSCLNPTLTTSPVTGEVVGKECVELRSKDGRCGPEGRYWLAKPRAIPAMPES